MSTRPPFREILTRGLRFGAFGGLGVYLYAVLTDNPSLYMSEARDPLDTRIDLDKLSYRQVQSIYEKHLERLRESQPEGSSPE